MSEQKLRNALDQTVERVIKKLDRKTMIENLPPAIEREFLTSLHQRLQDLIKPKLHQAIEGMLADYGLCHKLDSLDSRVGGTRQSKSHKAWRPEGVQSSTAAHDLNVMMEERRELETLLQQLNTEVETLERQVEDSEAVMTSNMETIEKRADTLKSVSDRVNDV